MASVKRLFTLSQPPQPISERAWWWLRFTYMVLHALLGLMTLFGLTILSGLFIPRQVASTAALTVLGLMLFAGVLTLACGVWSLHLRLSERFKVGSILITGAILMGAGTTGLLVLVGFLYLVTR